MQYSPPSDQPERKTLDVIADDLVTECHGIGETLVELEADNNIISIPQVAVVGGQNVGKSSLLSSLIGIPLPKATTVTTLMASTMDERLKSLGPQLANRDEVCSTCEMLKYLSTCRAFTPHHRTAAQRILHFFGVDVYESIPPNEKVRNSQQATKEDPASL